MPVFLNEWQNPLVIPDVSEEGAGVMTPELLALLESVAASLPPQAGQGGKFLETNGFSTSWQNAGGGASLPDNEIGFGDGTGITSDPSFTFDPTTGVLLGTAAAAVITGSPGAFGLTLFSGATHDSHLKLVDESNNSELTAGGGLYFTAGDAIKFISPHFNMNLSGDFSNDGMTAFSNGVLQLNTSTAMPMQGGLRNSGSHVQFSDDGATWNNITGGASVTPTAVKTANYNAVDGDLVRCNPTGGAFAVTLPAAASSKLIIVKNQSDSANAITITAGAGDTVDGAATFIMVNPRSSVTIYSDLISDWMIT